MRQVYVFQRMAYIELNENKRGRLVRNEALPFIFIPPLPVCIVFFRLSLKFYIFKKEHKKYLVGNLMKEQYKKGGDRNMGIIEVIVAAVNAYLEREKAKEDEQRSMDIINAINRQVIENRQTIQEALKDFKIDELTGLYLGQVENFKEYEPIDAHKDLLMNIAYDLNEEVFGPLIHLYDDENDVERVRKIVRLMLLVTNLRALVLSQLKFRYGDNRDDHVLEQLRYVRVCCTWLINNQLNRNYKPLFDAWNQCELNPPSGTTCVDSGEYDPWKTPTSCCLSKFEPYKVQRDILGQDYEQRDKLDEAIIHLEGTVFLWNWNVIKSNYKPKEYKQE